MHTLLSVWLMPGSLRNTRQRSSGSFLYYGQGCAIRERLGLQRKPHARHMGIPPTSLIGWESGQKQITRSAWEKYFKGVLPE